jgi:Uma2 family endonuclease
MTISDEKKQWSDEELLAMPRDGCKREIVHGELVMMSPAGWDHGGVIGFLFGELAHFVHSRRLGRVLDPQTGFRLATGDLFCPDMSFVTADRVAQQRARKSAFFLGAPDLFVEVLSPSDTVENLHEKLEQFFNEGARLAWVINPKKKCVYVYRAPHSFQTLQQADSLVGEEVIPGFTLPVSNLFQ